MENKKFVVTKEDVAVQDGKIIISSEELAQAIQSGEVDLNQEDEMDALNLFNLGCNTCFQ